MSILFSGDFHANACQELSLITKKNLVKKYTQAKFDKIKYHVILGDAGFLWPGNLKSDEYNFKVLANRPFPILCVIGNHEPILGMINDKSFDVPEADIGIGEKVWVVKKEKPFVAYLKRGKIYTIDKFKFLVLGGALSIDKKYRIPGRSWWPNEYWSEEEKDDLFKLLKKENEFDFVLTHTGPNIINKTVTFKNRTFYLPKFTDEVAALNEEIDSRITCKQWFCGHWHIDAYHYEESINREYQYLYKQTALLETKKVTVR